MAKKKREGALVPSIVPTSGPLSIGSGRMLGMPMFRWKDFDFFNQLPSVDMVDEGKLIRIKADIPGIEKEDIKLNVDKNSVTISVEARGEEERKGKNYYYKERSSSGYYRHIPLPSEVDPASAKAKLSNGTLEITVNKKSGAKTEVRVE